MQVFEYSRPESCYAVMAEISKNSISEVIRKTLHHSQPRTIRPIRSWGLGICCYKHVPKESKQRPEGPGGARNYKPRWVTLWPGQAMWPRTILVAPTFCQSRKKGNQICRAILTYVLFWSHSWYVTILRSIYSMRCGGRIKYWDAMEVTNSKKAILKTETLDS